MSKYGHHPDQEIDYEIEIERLLGLLSDAQCGCLRALDYRAATPEGLSIKYDVRHMLERSGFTGPLGVRTTP